MLQTVKSTLKGCTVWLMAQQQFNNSKANTESLGCVVDWLVLQRNLAVTNTLVAFALLTSNTHWFASGCMEATCTF